MRAARVAPRLLTNDAGRWFTSMLGKLSSLTHVVQALRDNKVRMPGSLEYACES